ncbi:DUF5336 domain-containing protein [Ramlibacter sp. AN1133]|uniref:DUF5336 domain-containing protein n=1 Tax=Ramlibacter sp. AN1133 TaxID=3133429 RepID=UPI0030BAF90C
MILELGGGAQLLRLFGWVLWALIAAGLVAALVFPPTRPRKALWALLVLSPVLAMVLTGWHTRSEFQDRQAEAQRLFDEHCKTAGVRIFRTVANVDSVLLMKRRLENWDTREQYALVDPYGTDTSGDGYAESFLWGRNKNGSPMSTAPSPFGYRYVVMVNSDGKGYTRYELTGRLDETGQLEVLRTPTSSLPRYAVSFEDISSRNDRDHWIAGSRLFVVDRNNGDVLAERVGWMFDRALGAADGMRHPWFFAAFNACPPFPTINNGVPKQRGQTRSFVERVLIPARETSK